MTANEDSPAEGHECIETEDLIHGTSLEDETDEFVAMVLEDQKQEAKVTMNNLTKALLNDDVPLTDEDVEELGEIGNAFRGLSATLALRVPIEQRKRFEDDES